MSKKDKNKLPRVNKLKTRRIFSEPFKRRKVEEINKGLLSVSEMSKLYKVSVQSIYKWLHKYSDYHEKGVIQVVQMESESQRTKELLDRVADLERRVGQKQLHIDYLEKLVEISSEELNIDLKKNFDMKSYPTSTVSSKKRVSK